MGVNRQSAATGEPGTLESPLKTQGEIEAAICEGTVVLSRSTLAGGRRTSTPT
jgi:hypothetical protein